MRGGSVLLLAIERSSQNCLSSVSIIIIIIIIIVAIIYSYSSYTLIIYTIIHFTPRYGTILIFPKPQGLSTEIPFQSLTNLFIFHEFIQLFTKKHEHHEQNAITIQQMQYDGIDNIRTII